MMTLLWLAALWLTAGSSAAIMAFAHDLELANHELDKEKYAAMVLLGPIIPLATLVIMAIYGKDPG